MTAGLLHRQESMYYGKWFYVGSGKSPAIWSASGITNFPILFVFFDADLVQMAMKEGKSMACVEDHTAWVIQNLAKRNTRSIKRETLPKLERWKEKSGAVFRVIEDSLRPLHKAQ